MGRKLRADQKGVFPYQNPNRFTERRAVLGRVMAQRAGLPIPEKRDRHYENLGNRNLPVWRKKSEIQRVIRDNQISMVEGPTGSGKSTQVAQYALEMGYKKIVYFEPRIPLADNVSDRFIVELNEQLGAGVGDGLVGVRHSERSTGRGKRIEVMTPDTFLRVFSEFGAYDDEPVLFVGDEIHERDFPNELAVAVAAQALPDHPKWRLCVMSATLDAEPIQRVYGEKLGREVPLVSVEGRPFDLEMIEEPDLTVEQAYEKYRAMHTKTQIFVAGKEEIREVTDAVVRRGYHNTTVTPFHAKLSRDRIRRATHARLPHGGKQVIPSTNAGASGITIPGQTLVISDGTVRRQDLDMDGVSGLFKRYCAQNEIIQEAGRAGRDVGGGLFVLACPDEDSNFDFRSFTDRETHAPAQIYHTNISRNVLATTALGYDFYNLNTWLINGVSERVVIEAYDTLYRLGAVDEKNKLTKIGKLMNKFPVRPELARALVAATQEGQSAETLCQLAATISAIETGGFPYFEKGVGSAWRNDIRPETNDDFMAQLDMFIASRQFYDGEDVNEAELEVRNYDIQQTKKAHRAYDKIRRTLGVGEHDLPLPPTGDEVELLRGYLAMGLFDYTHEKATDGGGSKKPTYVSIYDYDHEKPRTLSDRGVYAGREDLVIGMPRRFEKRVKGELQEFLVVENVTPVTRRMLAKAALWLTERIPHQTRIVNGRLETTDTLRLGSLVLGEADSAARVVHTDKTRELLREAALNKPTQTLRELTKIKKELEGLVRRAPKDALERLFPKGLLTDEWLWSLINTMIDGEVDTIFALDNNLRRYVVVNDISRSTWVSDEAIADILERSPDTLELANGQTYTLYYTHGQPIINGFNLKDADVLPDYLALDDGREVRINYRIGKDTKPHSAIDIKKYVGAL